MSGKVFGVRCPIPDCRQMIARMTEFLPHFSEVSRRAEQNFQRPTRNRCDIAGIAGPRRHTDAAGQNIRQSPENDTENGLRRDAGRLNILEAILNLIGSLRLAFNLGHEAGYLQRGQLYSCHHLPSDAVDVSRSRMRHLQSRHPGDERQKIHNIGDMDRDGRIELSCRFLVDGLNRSLPRCALADGQPAKLWKRRKDTGDRRSKCSREAAEWRHTRRLTVAMSTPPGTICIVAWLVFSLLMSGRLFVFSRCFTGWAMIISSMHMRSRWVA